MFCNVTMIKHSLFSYRTKPEHIYIYNINMENIYRDETIKTISLNLQNDKW